MPSTGKKKMNESRQNIIFENVTKKFKLRDREITVFENLNLLIAPDQFTMLIGKSGCGKTTLLRLLAGLEKPDSGRIIVPQDMHIGMMFQEPRLMYWLTVEKNITLGMHKPEQSAVDRVLSIVGLEGFKNAYPNQLSGGMQQRVSLARTLIRNTNLLLMDEPFSALDGFTRKTMQTELCRIKKDNNLGIIFVTHDINEATLLGERIITIHGGTTEDGIQI